MVKDKSNSSTPIASFNKRDPNETEEIIVSTIEALQAMVWEKMRPPSFALIVAVALGQILGKHDGNYTREMLDNLLLIMNETIVRNFEASEKELRERIENE